MIFSNIWCVIWRCFRKGANISKHKERDSRFQHGVAPSWHHHGRRCGLHATAAGRVSFCFWIKFQRESAAGLTGSGSAPDQSPPAGLSLITDFNCTAAFLLLYFYTLTLPSGDGTFIRKFKTIVPRSGHADISVIPITQHPRGHNASVLFNIWLWCCFLSDLFFCLLAEKRK